MNNIDIAKGAINFVVGSGITKIVNGIIVNNTNPETAYQKVAIASASVVIGFAAGDASKAYTNAKIDKVAAVLSKIKNRSSEAKTEETE